MFVGTPHTHNNYVWEGKATDRNQKCFKRDIVLHYFLLNSRLRELIEPSVGSEIECLSKRHQCLLLSSHSMRNAVRTQPTREMRSLDQGNTVNLFYNKIKFYSSSTFSSSCSVALRSSHWVKLKAIMTHLDIFFFLESSCIVEEE